jgi:hypothetical protein
MAVHRGQRKLELEADTARSPRMIVQPVLRREIVVSGVT